MAEDGLRLGYPQFPGKKKSKKELEEIRKREEEVAAAAAYEEFVASFDDPGKHGKTFVRGTTFNAGSREEKSTRDTGKLYKPSSKLSESFSSRKAVDSPPREETKAEKTKRKEKEKKKSNLELFKEELKIIQEEREERHKMKALIKEPSSYKSPVHSNKIVDDPIDPFPPIGRGGGGGGTDDFKPFNNMEDQSTTNLYLGNLNPKMTEQQLCEVFGKYGPLASIKVMWPRSEEEKARGRNCGFVAFMNRKDGERALKALNGKDIMNYEMKLGWGKAVPIPSYPVYIPPALMELTMPPPPSGLPFNAQPDRKDRSKLPPTGQPYILTDENEEEFHKILANAVVKVVVPTERNLLGLIHRMIEFVVREGPMFEAIIMNKELNNPMFRFLFENQSPSHVYYRWKLFSVLNGDSPSKWKIQEFRMFKGGSVWRPPPLNPYTQGMPEELVEEPKEIVDENVLKKGQLSHSQRDRFEDMLRSMTMERTKIAEAMIYCVEHAEAAEEVCECIAESLSLLHTPLPKKIARLYLISDVLHNCSVKIANVSFYRKGFQAKLPEIFKDMHEAYKAIEGRLKAEQFKQKVMGCFRAWEEWTIYPNEFLIKMQNVFLGLARDSRVKEEPQPEEKPAFVLPGFDGTTMDDDEDDVDGIPLESLHHHHHSDNASRSSSRRHDDLDGVPLGDDLDGQPVEETKPQLKYAPSKWEAVDPAVIEAQAMTTSKWDLLDQQDDGSNDDDSAMDVDGRPMDIDVDVKPVVDSNSAEVMRDREIKENLDFFKSGLEDRRSKLREIEMKVMKFQDELESGKRTRKHGLTILEQVDYYRNKLMKKERLKMEDKEDRDSDKRRDRRGGSSSPDERDTRGDRSRYRGSSPAPRRRVSRSRSRSPVRGRSRSRSPGYKKRISSSVSSATSSSSRYRVRSRSPSFRRRPISPNSPGRSSKKSSKKSSRH